MKYSTIGTYFTYKAATAAIPRMKYSAIGTYFTYKASTAAIPRMKYSAIGTYSTYEVQYYRNLFSNAHKIDEWILTDLVKEQFCLHQNPTAELFTLTTLIIINNNILLLIPMLRAPVAYLSATTSYY